MNVLSGDGDRVLPGKQPDTGHTPIRVADIAGRVTPSVDLPARRSLARRSGRARVAHVSDCVTVAARTAEGDGISGRRLVYYRQCWRGAVNCPGRRSGLQGTYVGAVVEVARRGICVVGEPPPIPQLRNA